MKRIAQIILGIVAALIIISVLCAYTYGVVFFSSHFYPGTEVNGIDASNLSADEVRHLLEEELNSYTLLIIGKDTKDILTAEDIGLSYIYMIDDSDILENAIKEQKSLQWIFSNDRKSITIEQNYNKEKVNTAIETLTCLNPDEKMEPQNAYLDYQDGEYVVVPEESGNILDSEEVCSIIYNALDELSSEISLDGMYPEAEIKSDDEFLNLQAKNANAILNADVTITSRVHTTTVDRDSLNSFLVFQRPLT